MSHGDTSWTPHGSPINLLHRRRSRERTRIDVSKPQDQYGADARVNPRPQAPVALGLTVVPGGSPSPDPFLCHLRLRLSSGAMLSLLPAALFHKDLEATSHHSLLADCSSPGGGHGGGSISSKQVSEWNVFKVLGVSLQAK